MVNTDLLSVFIEIIIIIGIGLLYKYVIPIVKNSVDQNTIYTISSWVRAAVYAAEQMMTKGSGKDKKQYVMEFMCNMLNEHDIQLTTEQLDVLIESAVKQMNIQIKPTT